MNVDLSDTAKIILYILCGFIVAINFSLVMALRSRARDEAALRAGRKITRPPWASKLDEPSAELARRVRQLEAEGHAQPAAEENPPKSGDTP